MARAFCLLLALGSTRVLLTLAALLGAISAARAGEAAVGVNVINPYVLSVADQNAMLDAIHAAGVSVIRASITLDDKGIDYAERAWQRGIRIEWLIYHFGGYDPFGSTPLSAADPEQFHATLQPVLDRLEAKGIVLAAFELGNEINLSGTNPEFVKQVGRARKLSLSDLENDPQGQRVAGGMGAEAGRCALPDDACANQRQRQDRKTDRNPSAHVNRIPRISEDLDANEEADGGTEQDAEQVRRGVVQSRKALILGHGHPGRCYHHDEQKKRP